MTFMRKNKETTRPAQTLFNQKKFVFLIDKSNVVTVKDRY